MVIKTVNMIVPDLKGELSNNLIDRITNILSIYFYRSANPQSPQIKKNPNINNTDAASESLTGMKQRVHTETPELFGVHLEHLTLPDEVLDQFHRVHGRLRRIDSRDGRRAAVVGVLVDRRDGELKVRLGHVEQHQSGPAMLDQGDLVGLGQSGELGL